MPGCPSRPAALIRGARRKPIAPASTVAGSTRAAPMSARSPGFVVTASRFRPARDEPAVLVEKRDDVRHRGERDEVEPAVEVCRAERLRELVDDAGSAELGKRIVGRTRRDDGAVGKRLARTVVVGDDDVEPQLLGVRDLLDRRDPAIDREDQPGFLAGEARQRLAGQAVALFEAARKMPVDLGAELAQHGDGQRRRADAVDVVVAVHADRLPVGDRCADRRARRLHVAEEERVVLEDVGFEERPALRRVGISPPDEHACRRLARGRARLPAPRPRGGGTESSSTCPRTYKRP